MKIVTLLILSSLFFQNSFASLSNPKTVELEQIISQKRTMKRELILKIRSLKKRVKRITLQQEVIELGLVTLKRKDKAFLKFRFKHFDDMINNYLGYDKFRDMLEKDEVNKDISKNILNLMSYLSQDLEMDELDITQEIQIILIDSKEESKLFSTLRLLEDVNKVDIETVNKLILTFTADKLKISNEIKELNKKWAEDD